MSIVKKILEKLRQLNLFADAETIRQRDMEAIQNQIILTRIYIILLVSVLSILIGSVLAIQKTTSVTIPTPSLDTHEQLQAKYSDTLSCPCQEVAVSYSVFLSISATYKGEKAILHLLLYSQKYSGSTWEYLGVPWKYLGVSWEYRGSTTGVRREYDGSTWEYHGSIWEYHGSTMEVFGSIMGVRWEYRGSTMGV